jgi:hypothetical protein
MVLEASNPPKPRGLLMFEIYRDGELKTTVNSWQEVYGYMQKTVPYSLNWAVKHEGWKVIDRRKEKGTN